MADKITQTNIPIVTHKLSEELESVYIIPLSDMQFGNSTFDEKAFIGYRDWILSKPNAFTVLPGDIFEAPVLGNKASEFWDMGLTPKEAYKKAVKLVKPLAEAGKILGVISGNHDLRIYKSTGNDMVEQLISNLGLPTSGKNSIYDPLALVIRLVMNKEFTYKLYMTHGWGGARRTGAQVNKTEELASVVTDADVYLLGHEHTLYASRWDSASIDNITSGECKQVRQLFVGCGTYCRYTSFQKGIQRRLPNIGSPRIRLEGVSGVKGHRDIHVSI